jgi:hypothetical protein
MQGVQEPPSNAAARVLMSSDNFAWRACSTMQRHAPAGEPGIMPCGMDPRFIAVTHLPWPTVDMPQRSTDGVHHR